MIYDGSILKVYDLRSTSTITTASFRTVAGSIYSGITITDAATKFAVSDDCSAVRINSKIAHWNSTAYVLDTINYPTGVTELANPAFSHDLSVIVTDAAIYYYTAINGNTAGSYSIVRNETFAVTKNVWVNGNNLVIFTDV